MSLNHNEELSQEELSALRYDSKFRQAGVGPSDAG